MSMAEFDEELRRVDIVLSQYEVCRYALVVSLTAISLCDGDQRNTRLGLFSRALDDFESGLFDFALRHAKAAAAPDLDGGGQAREHDYEAVRARLRRILAERPGRA